MKRFLKLLFLVALVAGVLVGISYVGARARVGTLLGSNPPVGNRSIHFDFEGVQNLPGQPRAWVFIYGSSSLPGVTRIRIVVSPTGRVLSMDPPDLDIRLEQWEESKLPPELRRRG